MALAVLALGLFTWSDPARADYTICNRTSGDVLVAVGYVNPGGGFVSEGWWTLRAGGHCEALVLDHETTDRHNYFFYAKEVGGGSVWEGGTRLCTTSRAFKIVGHQTGGNWCADNGFDDRYFNHVESGSGNHTTNLTGGSGGGVIID
jgi:uncharacterized membrane protein